MPITIYHKCHKCGGTGTWMTEYDSELNQEVSVTCPDCDGVGRLELCEIDSVFSTNVFWSYEIFEATVLSEYNSLTAAQKDEYQLILSMGQVDMNAGTNARSRLEAMFGAGTTTRANILALLS